LEEDLLKVHDAEYIWNLKKGLVEDTDTPAYENIYEIPDDEIAQVYKTIGENYVEVILEPQFRSVARGVTAGYEARALYTSEREVLASLQRKMWLGIASGRPRFEAELGLKRLRLCPYFESVVTLDECEKEEKRIFRSTGKQIKCSKPHPYSILRAVQEIGVSDPRRGSLPHPAHSHDRGFPDRPDDRQSPPA
jgi:phosphoglycolate phosphatase-like HAD superfamily hydrolase